MGSLLTAIFRIALQSSIMFCCAPAVQRRQPSSSAPLQLRVVNCGDMCGQVAVLHVWSRRSPAYEKDLCGVSMLLTGGVVDTMLSMWHVARR